MTRSKLLPVVAAFMAASTVRASDDSPSVLPSDLDVSARLWIMPEVSPSRNGSPFGPAASLAGIGDERGRGEAGIRLHTGGLTADLSARSTARENRTLKTQGVVNELFYEIDFAGQHFTLGKRNMAWDVGFGYRPLDVVQQEDRRAVHPFTREGVPILAWEFFDAETALALVYANPLRGRAPRPRDDESVASRVYRRLGVLDLHLITRYSERTKLQTGTAGSIVVGDALELHGSVRWQRRGERMVDRLAGGELSPLADTDPVDLAVSQDVFAALVGANLSPGWDLNLIVEAWLDPSGSSAEEWAALGVLARRQRTLLASGGAPADAVLGNLAWGLRMYDRANLLRQNVLLHLSRKSGRFEPSLDLLFTPEDRGWVVTASTAWEGEQIRADAGVRLFGGPPDSAYRLFPQSAILYVACQIAL